MRIQTMPYADLLVHGEEALVLLADDIGTVPGSSRADGEGGTIARLSAIGAAVLQLAEHGVDFDELAQALESRFGAPAAGTTQHALEAVLTALHAQRLVDLSHDQGGGQ